MAHKSSFDEMHERILQGALEVFSEKGFSAATIKDISTRVGCNSITIFRHFEDKQTLFIHVVERFHKLEFDEEQLHSKLSYTNIHADLNIIANYFFKVLFQHINILRIYINDGPYFERIAKYIWYLPEPFKDFVVEYIDTVYPDVISPVDAALIAEMLIAFITRTCLRVNVHEGIEAYSKKIADDAKIVMATSVNMILNIIMKHVKSA